MDLRGLDRFVDHPPGRAGNLYDTFGDTENGIDETPINFYKSYPSDIQCTLAATGGTNLCFQQHALPRKELIPPRRVEFDLNVENLREGQYVEPVPYIPMRIKEKQGNFIVPVAIILILLFILR